MDIKLIKNSEKGIILPINNKLLMQITDDNYQYQGLQGKKYFILNAATNEKAEIAPQIKKYHFCRIKYACLERNYIFFSSLESVTESKTLLTVYRFMFDSNESQAVYSMEIDNSDIVNGYIYYIFVMDSNYFFVEKLDNASRLMDIFLHDINSESDNDLSDTIIKDMGIYKVIPAGGNNCVIKFGPDKLIPGNNHLGEKIALLNAKQFVSEISFNGQMLTMEEIDISDDDTTFPYIKASGNRIIYSKYNLKNKSEEIVIYDASTKIKQVRLNNNVERAMDLSYTYIINDTPFIVKREDKNTYFINLNNQKAEFRLHSDMSFKYMMNDIIVVTRQKHRIFFIKKPSEYIEAYRISDLHRPMFSTKAEYNGCVKSGDDLIIFTN